MDLDGGDQHCDGCGFDVVLLLEKLCFFWRTMIWMFHLQFNSVRVPYAFMDYWNQRIVQTAGGVGSRSLARMIFPQLAIFSGAGGGGVLVLQ